MIGLSCWPWLRSQRHVTFVSSILLFAFGTYGLCPRHVVLRSQIISDSSCIAGANVQYRSHGKSHGKWQLSSIESTNDNGEKPLSTPVISSRRKFFFQASFAVSIASSSIPSASSALSPQQAATDYNSYASNYDDLDGGQASTMLGIDQAREALFKLASGDVLEIGAGTGLNLNKYQPKQLKSLTLLDVSEGMLDQAYQRFQKIISTPESDWSGVEVKFVRADATDELVKKFGGQSFDTVVDSFSLCVMGNNGARRCLEQIQQVVKLRTYGGRVLLLENSRSSNALLGLYQDATAEAAASSGGKGCVYNQDVGALIRATPGLKIETEKALAAGLFRSFQCFSEPAMGEELV